LTTALPPPKVGLAYRLPLGSWVMSRPPGLECLEITAEHFYRLDGAPLRRLAERYPLVVHTSSLSLGTPGPLDQSELERFDAVVSTADPLWISEHLGFRRTGDMDLGCPQPVSLTHESLALVVEHAREIMARCRKRLLLENIVSHISIRGAVAEPDFLNRFCEDSGGGILLDLTSLVVNARTHRFDPREWLRRIEADRVIAAHVGHAAGEEGRWVVRHEGRVDEEVWDLAEDLLALAPGATVILERDGNFPPVADLAAELRRLEALRRAGTPAHGSSHPGSAHP
jgi:uncharacterized protein (UPF0276 family)